MIFSRSIDRLDEIFLSQFEQEGEQVFYRKHGRGAPIPVTAEKGEEFRRKYRKASRRMIWGTVTITVVAIVLGALISPELLDEGPGLIVIATGTIGAIAVLSVRNSTAPARALIGRAPIGSKLTKAEWQSRHFAATSWPLLGSLFLFSTFFCISHVATSEFREWSDYFWAFVSGILSIFGARALWLKYQLPKRTN